MANEEHLKVLDQGVLAWNEWRLNYPEIMPDLQNAKLRGAVLSVESPPEDVKEITRVFAFIGVDLSGTDLRGADLSQAQIREGSLKYANLHDADLSQALLLGTNFTGALLDHTDFNQARVGWNTFGNVDLRLAKGLDTLIHHGPSVVGIDTLYRSAGRISENFLRGCGVPDDFITFIPSIIGAQQALQFYSCFISYSHKDEEFARRLHSRLRSEQIRVWFAAEDVKAGQKLYEQIDRAIQIHDRLLLVLSESSLQSEWVMSEIRKARKVEIEEKRQKLFPLRLVDFETIRKWECFDADNGKDLAVEVREYFIPDFSNWKNHDAFEASFGRLLNDLQRVPVVS